MGTNQAQLPISLEFSQLKRFCFLLGKVSDTNQWDVLWSHVAQRPSSVRHTFVPLCYMGQSTTGSLLTMVNSTADGCWQAKCSLWSSPILFLQYELQSVLQ